MPGDNECATSNSIAADNGDRAAFPAIGRARSSPPSAIARGGGSSGPHDRRGAVASQSAAGGAPFRTVAACAFRGMTAVKPPPASAESTHGAAAVEAQLAARSVGTGRWRARHASGAHPGNEPSIPASGSRWPVARGRSRKAEYTRCDRGPVRGDPVHAPRARRSGALRGGIRSAGLTLCRSARRLLDSRSARSTDAGGAHAGANAATSTQGHEHRPVQRTARTGGAGAVLAARGKLAAPRCAEHYMVGRSTSSHAHGTWLTYSPRARAASPRQCLCGRAPPHGLPLSAGPSRPRLPARTPERDAFFLLPPCAGQASCSQRRGTPRFRPGYARVRAALTRSCICHTRLCVLTALAMAVCLPPLLLRRPPACAWRPRRRLRPWPETRRCGSRPERIVELCRPAAASGRPPGAVAANSTRLSRRDIGGLRGLLQSREDGNFGAGNHVVSTRAGGGAGSR